MNNINISSNLNSLYPQSRLYLPNDKFTTPVSSRNSVYAEQPEDNVPKVFGVAALLQVLAMSLNKISDWCGKKLMQGKEFTTAENVKKTADYMVNKNKLDVNIGYIDRGNMANFARHYDSRILNELSVVADGRNAFYMNGAKLAVAPKVKPSLILHELGHAINDQKGGIMHLLQKLRGIGTAVPTALLLLNRLIPKGEGEKENFVQKNAGLIGFSAFLPTIIEEGAASIKGIRAAKSVLGKSVNLSMLKRNYAFAWLTYLIAGLGLGVAAKQAIVYEK